MPETKADHWKRAGMAIYMTFISPSTEAGKKKLSYTHSVLASNKELAELEDLMLRSQDKKGLEDFN